MFDDIEFTGQGLFWTAMGVITIANQIAYAIEGEASVRAKREAAWKRFEDEFNRATSSYDTEYKASF